jgi:hypothetical protein
MTITRQARAAPPNIKCQDQVNDDDDDDLFLFAMDMSTVEDHALLPRPSPSTK